MFSLWRCCRRLSLFQIIYSYLFAFIFLSLAFPSFVIPSPLILLQMPGRAVAKSRFIFCFVYCRNHYYLSRLFAPLVESLLLTLRRASIHICFILPSPSRAIAMSFSIFNAFFSSVFSTQLLQAARCLAQLVLICYDLQREALSPLAALRNMLCLCIFLSSVAVAF